MRAGFYEEFSMSEMKGIVAPAYKNWQEQDYKDYMEQFGLNPKQKISTLSKGMKIKFSLALALSHEPDLEQIADRLILIDNGRILFQEKILCLEDTGL